MQKFSNNYFFTHKIFDNVILGSGNILMTCLTDGMWTSDISVICRFYKRYFYQ